MGLTPKRGQGLDVNPPVYPMEIENGAYFAGHYGPTGFLRRTFTESPADRTKATFHFNFKPRVGVGQGYMVTPFAHGPHETFGEPKLNIAIGEDTLTPYGFSLHQTNASGTVTGNYRCMNPHLFTDPTSWAHVVLAIDTTLTDAADRCKLFVNGVRRELEATTPFSQGSDINWGDPDHPHVIGGAVSPSYDSAALAQANCNVARVIALTGQALGPEAFGQWSPVIPGLWVPRRFSGTFGPTDFSLDFADVAALGRDVSGNGNDFAVHGTVVQTEDTPTNNHCVLNTLIQPLDGTYRRGFAEGNTEIGGRTEVGYGTLPLPSAGKYYFEVDCVAVTANASYHHVGVGRGADALNGSGYELHRQSKVTWSEKGHTRTGLEANTPFGHLPPYTTGDTLGVLVDCDTNEVRFRKNNEVNERVFPLPFDSEGYTAVMSVYGTASRLRFNSGARGFKYALPDGYKSLCSKNLPDPAVINPASGNDVVLWTGNGTAQDIGGLGFQPDYMNIKRRDGTGSWVVTDSVRGVDRQLFTEVANVQTTNTEYVTAISESGFGIGNRAEVNTADASYLAQCLKIGPEFGFDVITYTGDGVTGRQIAHNCGGVPEMIIVKGLSVAQHWWGYHHALGPTKYLALNLPNASAASAADDLWNHATPTSANVILGGRVTVNGVGEEYVMYVYRSVPGFSKVFSYKGNNSVDGPFIDLGFRPATWILKEVESTRNWVFQNNRSTPVNPIDRALLCNLSGEESFTGTTAYIASSGLKIAFAGSAWNQLNKLHVGIAWADQPFKYSNAF